MNSGVKNLQPHVEAEGFIYNYAIEFLMGVR
jgi:hypothetical protein